MMIDSWSLNYPVVLLVQPDSELVRVLGYEGKSVPAKLSG
jgi:hypothetical protein